MPTPHLSLSRVAEPVADPSVLARLPHAGASHDDVRRYSRARRNLLPRADHVTAVAGGWAHEIVLGSGASVETVLWCPTERRHPSLEATAARMVLRAGRALRISARTLARIHPGLTAPALVSVVRLPRWPALVPPGRGGLVLVADGIGYAGNLGTLIRTADACAVDALVLTRATARVTHPKAFVASRGTVLTTPVLEYADVVTARSDLAAAGYTTYVADPAGATSYRRAGLGAGPTAVVVGSEGDGVAEEWRSGLTRVAIPMRGRADSLNVAASAAVLLFEARGRAEDAATAGLRDRPGDPA
jgi:TrmH family RNA methyltransferase